MSLPSVIFLVLAVAQLGVLGLHIIFYFRKTRLGQLSLLFVGCLICYLLAEALVEFGLAGQSSTWSILRFIFHRIGDLSIFVIWLIAYILFRDNVRIRDLNRIIWVLIISTPIVRGIASYFTSFTPLTTRDLFNNTAWIYSQTVLFSFAVAALHLAVRGYNSDLVLRRRQERVVFVVSAAILLVTISINRGFWLNDLVSGTTPAIQPIPTITYYIYTYLVTSALFLWKFKSIDLSTRAVEPVLTTPPKSKTVQPLDKGLLTRIKRVMEIEKLYREPKLTVSGLAKHAESQEYLVRQAINSHLGYRNFSDFLNYYRIGEASKMLIETDEPVTNIGLDVGYGSLSSFFKAFKNRHGIAPLEYRAKHKSGTQ